MAVRRICFTVLVNYCLCVLERANFVNDTFLHFKKENISFILLSQTIATFLLTTQR